MIGLTDWTMQRQAAKECGGSCESRRAAAAPKGPKLLGQPSRHGSDLRVSAAPSARLPLLSPHAPGR